MAAQQPAAMAAARRGGFRPRVANGFLLLATGLFLAAGALAATAWSWDRGALLLRVGAESPIAGFSVQGLFKAMIWGRAGDHDDDSSAIAWLLAELRSEREREQIADWAHDAWLENATAQDEIRRNADDKLMALYPGLARERRETALAWNRTGQVESMVDEATAALAMAERERESVNRSIVDATSMRQEAESSLRSLWSFGQWLNSCPYQLGIAAVAGIVGFTSILDSVIMANLFCIGLLAISLGTWASMWWGAYAGILMAAISASAAIAGIGGFQLLVGLLVGLSVANETAAWMLALGSLSALPLCLWRLLGCFAGASLMVLTKDMALAVLGHALGGFLVGSCAFFVLAPAPAPAPSTWLAAAECFLHGRGDWAPRFVGLALGCSVALEGIRKPRCLLPLAPRHVWRSGRAAAVEEAKEVEQEEVEACESLRVPLLGVSLRGRGLQH
jgi:hypothetical protein